jgi:serine O-acetyltransferase
MDGGLGTMQETTHARQAGRGALRADYARYLRIAQASYPGVRGHLEALAEFGFLAIAVYRYGRWTRGLPRLVGLPFKLLYRVLEMLTRMLFGIYISGNSEIGPGFHIGHAGGICIDARLGANCSIAQGVTIGAKGAGRSGVGLPRLGNNVYLGAGSMVVGAVTVGDDVIVGANTVVVQDVPAGSRVVSAPARILPPRDPQGVAQ